MHGMHARLPKNFVLEERLIRYRDQIELFGPLMAGVWREAAQVIGRKPFSSVRLDLGCGKGTFLVEAARREPDVLFIGMDAEPICIAYAAQHICEANLTNALVIPGKGEAVQGCFATSELERIYLNFPTPYPRKKEADRRLVSYERLMEYREVLGPTSELRLRTDSLPLRDFALEELDAAGYEIVHLSDDERAANPDEPTSEYEMRLTELGAKVLSIWATPSKEPKEPLAGRSLSLSDYIPDDLFEGAYVPHGMAGTIVNLRNRRARQR